MNKLGDTNTTESAFAFEEWAYTTIDELAFAINNDR